MTNEYSPECAVFESTLIEYHVIQIIKLGILIRYIGFVGLNIEKRRNKKKIMNRMKSFMIRNQNSIFHHLLHLIQFHINTHTQREMYE